jgi:hypothetical protein
VWHERGGKGRGREGGKLLRGRKREREGALQREILFVRVFILFFI